MQTVLRPKFTYLAQSCGSDQVYTSSPLWSKGFFDSVEEDDEVLDSSYNDSESEDNSVAYQGERGSDDHNSTATEDSGMALQGRSDPLLPMVGV